ncbi:hypothetical protein HK27_13010 [Acetobacter orientalis]|uniref:hypothetical protein n=1 Tax=Acetobacter orientalis TaxID=146474 RepID=UPI000A3A33EA|nr:hypothetical protein [Acetobacter orientalis]OUJ14856.1 hypothetical protein HK27_13010 [Acetobacter orientalis]
MLGDSGKFESGVGSDITNAHIALRDGVANIATLLHDATRNDVQRHEAASVVAGRAVEALQKAKAGPKSYSATAQRCTKARTLPPSSSICQSFWLEVDLPFTSPEPPVCSVISNQTGGGRIQIGRGLARQVI